MVKEDIRWKQRFENFQRAYKLLEKYASMNGKTTSELERAGVIQFFEMAFELSWKVMKDYLENQGMIVKSPRETIKTAVQVELIENGHIWIDALSNRNLTTHLYDEQLAEKALWLIVNDYYPIIKQLHNTLEKEV